MKKTCNRFLPAEADTIVFANIFARALSQASLSPCVIFLRGPLGAGKTTFVRGMLQGMGHAAKVKSPTYTLVESYVLNEQMIYHLDLYRLADPRELLTMGLEDYFTGEAICLIEWPEKGQALLPAPDLSLTFSLAASGGEGRQIHVDACSPKGQAVLASLVEVGG